ncbi:MAG TPA: septal ring lytic transglycosylase RlpA family protein [Polyangiaceae bacterium]
MIFFGAEECALFRRSVALSVGALAIVTCRTPPPLPSSPAMAGESPAPPVAPGEASAGRPPEAPAPAGASAIETAKARDFSVEQRELAERYAKHRALSTLRGEASYYGKAFAGRKTASGETFEPARYTAAHRSLPFGTVLRVTRLQKKQSVVYVRVNDRGPFGKKRRIIDLSEAAAGELDMLRDGVCEVRVEVLERGKP